jgi:hypothetical protein
VVSVVVLPPVLPVSPLLLVHAAGGVRRCRWRSLVLVGAEAVPVVVPLSETVPSPAVVVGVLALSPVVGRTPPLLEPGSPVVLPELLPPSLPATSSAQAPRPSTRAEAKIHGEAVGWAMGPP